MYTQWLPLAVTILSTAHGMEEGGSVLEGRREKLNQSFNILDFLLNVIAEDVSKLEPVLAERKGKLNLRLPQNLNFKPWMFY